MSTLIDYLESINLLTEERLYDYICENDVATLNGLVLYIRELIDADYEISKYTPFVFVPNGDISGTSGCAELSCRMSRAEKFAIFSALYADKVYIQLEFITQEHYEFIDIEEIEMDEELSYIYKIDVLKDLSIILIYAELIKSNIIIITPSHKMLCMNCFQREMFGKSVIDIEKIKREYRSKAKVILKDYDEKNEDVGIIISNIDEFFPDHDLFWNIHGKDLIEMLKNEKIGEIISNQEYCDNFVDEFISEEILSAMYTAKYCREQNAKLITNKLSDAMFLSLRNENQSLAEVKNYTNYLPEYDLLITNNLSLKNVIKLREEESESFNKYRIALNRAVIEQNKTMDATDWKRIYDDIIYPELNNLDMKIKQIKNGRFNRFFGSMAVVGTALVANAFGNTINPDMFSFLPTVATTVGTGGVNYFLDKSSVKKAELQNNDYFFLWKLKKSNEAKFKL